MSDRDTIAADINSKNISTFYSGLLAAVQRLKGHAHRTLVMTSRTLNERVGAQVYLKCESFQRMGAFKYRGAFNAISQLSPQAQARGILTYSSGNHAQAVALVCRELGLEATIVMPTNAPQTKREATANYGATIVDYDPATTAREDLAAELAAQHGYIIIPPYDHLDIIYGQGTAAYELLQDVKDLDLILTPVGGGGLLSGSAIAVKGRRPATRVIGIEPDLADDATRSFRSGQLHTVQNPPTIADGTRTPYLGAHNFPLVLRFVDDMQTVSEAAIIEAVRFAFYRMKLVMEPSGALGLAALLSGVVPIQGHPKIGVIVSGGNIDASTMANILSAD